MDEIIDRCSAAIKLAKHGTMNNAREEFTSVSKMGVKSEFRELEYMLECDFSHVAPKKGGAMVLTEIQVQCKRNNDRPFHCTQFH
jgi:hypothetical protein